MENPFAPRFDRHDEPNPKQIAFEESRVRLVLERFGLSSYIPQMIQSFEDKWAKKWLTFETLFEFFPSFPILLEAHSFYHVSAHCRPASIFRAFEETFVLRRYLDVFARGQEEACGRPIGMVLPFDGFQGGVVIHNGLFNTGGTKIVHDIVGDAPPHRVAVEPFIPFIRHLARGGWTPKTPLPRVTTIQQPQVSPELSFTPWMVDKLGDGAALVVLAWLRTVLRSTSGYHRQLVRRTTENECCVAATQEQIAAETHCSLRKVRRGIAELKNQRLIATTTQQRRSYFSLSVEALAGAEVESRHNSFKK